MKTIYIAGPEVFMPYGRTLADEHKQICREYGYVALHPLDNQDKDNTPQNIFRANLKMVICADYVIADLNNFRGQTVDDGTAFELGFAYALGKPLYGYVSDARSLRERFGAYDLDDCKFEDFGLPVNLMLAMSMTIVEGSFRKCIESLKPLLD